MDFHENFELVGMRGVQQVHEAGLVEGGDDKQDGIGSGDYGFKDLRLVDDEVFAQHGDVHLLPDVRHVVEPALEVFLVR